MTHSTHRSDGYRDAQAGLPPSPPESPWLAHHAAIQAEYMDGYTTGREESERYHHAELQAFADMPAHYLENTKC